MHEHSLPTSATSIHKKISPFKLVNGTISKKMRQCSATNTPIETKIIEYPMKLALTSEAK